MLSQSLISSILLICVISSLQAAPSRTTNTTKTVKSLVDRPKKGHFKSTPITYISALADNHHHNQHYQPIKKSLELHGEGKHLDDQKKAKVKHHGDKSSAKSLDINKKKTKEVLDNHELLSKLGLGKLRVSSSHHKKRLAVESRHHGRPDDSHMFVIKLPPNPYYYTNNAPMSSRNSIDDTSKKVPVGFKSNGKPGRIYHWNIPVLKKILGNNHGRNPNSRHSDNEAELIDIKNIPTWTKPWENDTVEKSLMKYGQSELNEKVLKKKSPSYYAPIKPKKNNFSKYFAGNGKPQSFYVIEKSPKSHKPIYHHKLLP